MKITHLCVALFSFALLAPATQAEPHEKEIGYRHLVCFSFKDGMQDDDYTRVIDSFLELENSMEEVISIETGFIDESSRGVDGFTHAFLVSFADQEGLKSYGPHPAHEEFKALLKPFMKDVLVIDYSIRE